MTRPILEVANLQVYFLARAGLFASNQRMVRAVDGVSFAIDPGETLGLVGESGCGKTTLGRAAVRLLKPTGGRIYFDGLDITSLEGQQLRALRRGFQIIFQDPYGSFDPYTSVGKSVGEALDIHHLAPNGRARRQTIERLLADVGLDASQAERYPHEFSGGQRQRLGIARALAVDPALIVCDEAVSALDVSVQAQIVNLLEDLQRQRGMAYLFIAHDLAVVAHISRRIMVMYLGRIVESGPAAAVCRSPRHPYTQALVSAVPTLNPADKRRRIVLPGEVPSPIRPPGGCPFHPRCPVAEARCATQVPVLREVASGHWVSCHLA